jgi:hypothetical protein
MNSLHDKKQVSSDDESRCIYVLPFASLSQARRTVLDAFVGNSKVVEAPTPDSFEASNSSLPRKTSAFSSLWGSKSKSEDSPNLKQDLDTLGLNLVLQAIETLEKNISKNTCTSLEETINLSILRAQVAARYDPYWGTLSGWPVLVEEDCEILLEALTESKLHQDEAEWNLIVDEPTESLLKVYFQERSDSPIRTVMATATLSGHKAGIIYSAIANQSNYSRWDRTWSAIAEAGKLGEELEKKNLTQESNSPQKASKSSFWASSSQSPSKVSSPSSTPTESPIQTPSQSPSKQTNSVSPIIDIFNHIYHFLSDLPPAPYSLLITQRDFVMSLHRFFNPRTRIGVIALRNTSHPSSAVHSSYIRGESLGCVGFIIVPHDLKNVDGETKTRVIMHTAADPKGTLPTTVINFVARRTPRVWMQRLRNSLEIFAEEDRINSGLSSLKIE